jgi:hypothetical protein
MIVIGWDVMEMQRKRQAIRSSIIDQCRRGYQGRGCDAAGAAFNMAYDGDDDRTI